MKQFDVFSFKNAKIPKTTKNATTDYISRTNPTLSSSNKIQPNSIINSSINKPTNMAHYQYRIDKINQKIKQKQDIHKKIMNIQKEMQGNIRRRHQLQHKLLSQSMLERQKKYGTNAIQAVKQNNLRMQAKKFAQIHSYRNKNPEPDYFSPVKSKTGGEFNKTIMDQRNWSLKKDKPRLNQKQLLQISRIITFPQKPSQQILLKYQQKLEKYLFNSDTGHSDIIYLLIIIYYHKQQFKKGLEKFQQILKFKKFNPLVYWIIAQTFFKMQNYQKCLKIVQIAISNLSQKYFPRLLYLKAFSSVQNFNYTDGIVCYNQLISICPKVPQYYLQRAILFERTRYYDYAKSDFLQYKRLKPRWQMQIKQKILLQKNIIKQQNMRFTLKALKNY